MNNASDDAKNASADYPECRPTTNSANDVAEFSATERWIGALIIAFTMMLLPPTIAVVAIGILGIYDVEAIMEMIYFFAPVWGLVFIVGLIGGFWGLGRSKKGA